MSNPETAIAPVPSPVAIDPTRGFDRVLFELSMSDAVTNGRLEDALREICSTASRALDVRSTNVWLFDPSHTMLCESVTFTRDRGGLPFASLAIAANPSYFTALQQRRVVAADDVETDPRTAAFYDGYFRPRGITATLDAPVRLHGRLLGVVCHEHVGGARAWDAEEERFAASLGDLVALALVADERASAQRAVRESEARYRMLIDGVRDLIFNLDGIGTVTSVNPALEALLGFAPQTWLGKHFMGLIHPEDAALAGGLFERAMSGNEIPNFEIRLRHAAGHTVWVEFTISIERAGGAVRGVFGVGRDVTARKQIDVRRRVLVEIGLLLARAGADVEGALGTIHELLAGALDADEVATALCEPASATVSTLVRHPAGSAHGAGQQEGVAALGPAAAEVAGRALGRGETSVAHVRREGAADADDGQVAVACALRAPEGVLGAIIVQRRGRTPIDGEQIDLLDRVAREVALAIAAARRSREAAENAELSSALARVGQVLITSLDLPLLLERLCRVTAEVLGCDASYTFLRDESLGAFVRTAAFGDSPQVDEALRALPILDSQTPGLAEALERDRVVVSRAGDGVIAAQLWDAYGTRSTMVIALLHGSRLVGALAAAFRRDDAVFGPRQLRIARGIAQLASLAIANARLVGELEAVGRIKSDFVATMSHELRTPLNVILGYTDLLLLEEFGSLSAEQADTLQRVRASTTELQELIEATLDLSRLESGTVALRVESVDLRSWLDEVRAETRSLHERKPHLDLRWHLAAPPEAVRCDALKLKVILKNLVGNALKFTTEGGIDVAVTVRDGALTIAVRDTGIGMTPEVQAVVFDAFRQGDASLTRPYGGVGLGLYIVRRLVEAQRGRIELESAPGQGSEFRIAIPLDARSAR